MRKIAWIVVITFWLFSAVSTSDVFASFGKDTPVPEPPPCPAKFDDSLETDGIVGRSAGGFQHGVTPPKPTVSPEAEFSDTARKEFKKKHLKRFDGVSVLSMVVGVDGTPRDVCLVKAAGYDLDAKAAEAAWKYRFKAATRDGKPVPVRITIEVNFRLSRGFW